MSLQTKLDLHLERKLFHTVGVLMIFGIYEWLPHNVSWGLFLFALVGAVSTDFLRLRYPQFNKLAIGLLRPVVRQEEYDSCSAVTYLMIGVTLCRLFFPELVVSISLLFLAFGDPVASAFGILYGRKKIMGNKSDAGFFAAFVACSIVLWAYNSYHGFFSSWTVAFCLLGGLIGAISELIPVGKLDDNLSQPLLSGALLTALFYFIEIL